MYVSLPSNFTTTLSAIKNLFFFLPSHPSFFFSPLFFLHLDFSFFYVFSFHHFLSFFVVFCCFFVVFCCFFCFCFAFHCFLSEISKDNNNLSGSKRFHCVQKTPQRIFSFLLLFTFYNLHISFHLLLPFSDHLALHTTDKDSLIECFLPEINSSLKCTEPVDM